MACGNIGEIEKILSVSREKIAKEFKFNRKKSI